MKIVKKLINEWKRSGIKIYMTSGGFDPMHVGHVRCIRETARIAQANGGKTLIVVNGDQFLINKKGKAFMPANERCEIIAAIEGVDAVVEWYDGTQTVSGAIKEFGPDFFTKGGDRDCAQNIPEWETCEEVGCRIILGVGGAKVQSSSSLIKNGAEDSE